MVELSFQLSNQKNDLQTKDMEFYNNKSFKHSHVHFLACGESQVCSRLIPHKTKSIYSECLSLRILRKRKLSPGGLTLKRSCTFFFAQCTINLMRPQWETKTIDAERGKLFGSKFGYILITF